MLLAAGAAVVALLLDPRLAVRWFSSDGVLNQYTLHWLAIYRTSAWVVSTGLFVVAGLGFACRSVAQAWVARWWLLVCRCALSLLSLVVASVVLEIVARTLDAFGSPTHLVDDPDALARAFMESVQPQLNSDGMRDDSFDRPRGAGEHRVLVIGDSFAFGFGIAERERTIPAVLEADLAAHGPFDVFNAGIPGADTWRELEAFRALRTRVDPDLVLIAWYVNDTESDDEKRAYKRQHRLVPLLSAILLRSSAAWRRFEPLAIATLERLGLESTYVDHLKTLYGVPDGGPWSQREAFVHLLVEASANGPRAAVVLFPLIEDLVHYPMEEVHALVKQACADGGVPCLDLLELFRGESAAALQAGPLDHHLNEVAAARAAHAIAEFLAREHLLDLTRSR